MAELFDKYLSQIEKKLRRQSVAKDFIDEFLENMSAQLYSMSEELMGREPELDSSEAAVSVLSGCDPVDVVVSQVIEQYHSEEAVPKIDTGESLKRLKFLVPVESKLESLSRRMNRDIDAMNHRYQTWLNWYSNHLNPSLTALVYLAAWLGSVGLLLLIGSVIPPLYLVRIYPDNLTFLHFGDPSSVLVNYPLTTSVSLAPLLPAFPILLSMFLLVYIVGRIGWNYQIKYSIPVIVVFSLLLALIVVLTEQSNRLSPIVLQVSSDSVWTFFAQDWYLGETITSLDYMRYFIVSVYTRWLPYIIIPLLGIVLASSALKPLKNRMVRKPLVFSGARIMTMLVIAALFISALSIIPPSYARIHEGKNIPIPDSDIPLIYQFELNWEETYQSIDGFQSTVLPQFGHLEFSVFSIYHLVNLQYASDIYATGNLSVLFNQEESYSSLYSFDLLGLLYLPDIEENGGWQGLIGDEINSSYPFNGFAPEANETDNLLSWRVNGEKANISVNTVVYSANANDSEYVFHFDSVHGWLMGAVLRLHNESWIHGLDVRTLTISRRFSIQPLQQSDLERFYALDILLILPLLGVVILIILVDGIRLMRKGSWAQVDVPKSVSKQSDQGN